MAIDSEFVVRQALEVAQLDVDRVRAAELAIEVRGLIENGRAIAEGIAFDDDPSHFLAVLAALADPPLP